MRKPADGYLETATNASGKASRCPSVASSSSSLLCLLCEVSSRSPSSTTSSTTSVPHRKSRSRSLILICGTCLQSCLLSVLRNPARSCRPLRPRNRLAARSHRQIRPTKQKIRVSKYTCVRMFTCRGNVQRFAMSQHSRLYPAQCLPHHSDLFETESEICLVNFLSARFVSNFKLQILNLEFT